MKFCSLKRTVQGALEWLEANQDKSIEEISISEAAELKDETDPSIEPVALNAGEVAHSLTCNDCGKKFRSQAQAEIHAHRTEHINFAESTEEIAPLTEEEKKAKLDDLRQKLAEKRAGMSEQDKIDKKRNEVRNWTFLEHEGWRSSGLLGNTAEEHQRGARHQGGPEEEGAAQGSCC